MKYEIQAWRIDSDFGGVIINAVIDGEECELKAQLLFEPPCEWFKGAYYMGRDCKGFLNGSEINEKDSPDEICRIFARIETHVVTEINTEISSGRAVGYAF